MPLGVLNNISAIYAENNLNQTQASLQNTLTQLSSGSRINSGADDSAGLAIANGLEANSSALTQSSANATAGVGFLQVADGALSQVTNLLNRAITLATEAGGGTLSSSQMSAADQEYQDILTQIGTIGSTTEYNNIQVFGADQSMSGLTWAEGSGAAGSSATGAAALVQSSAIVAGGSTAGTAPTLTQTYATATSFNWTLSGTGATGTLTSDAISSGAKLSGHLTFASAGTGGASISIDLSQVTGGTLSAEATSLQGLLNTNFGTGGDADYAVTVAGTNSNELRISLGASASGDQITGLGSNSGTTDQALGNGFTLSGITAGDWLNGTISLAGAGGGTGSIPSSISLAGVNQGSLVSSLDTQLSVGTSNPDYTVAYSSGTLTVALTANAAGDGINGLVATPGTGSNALAQSAATAGSISFTNGDILGGQFSITPTVAGTASASDLKTIDLNGVTTANLQSSVISQLGSLSSDYNVSYNATSGDLTISVSATGLAANFDAVSVVNGSGNNALSQSQAVVSSLASTSTVLGDFTLTPSTSSGAGTAIAVDLSKTQASQTTNGTTSSPLATAVQSALGDNYLVSYDATAGALSISVSSTGVAAGVTGFTVAEASQAAASQLTAVSGGVNIYTSDGTSTGSKNYNVTVGQLSDTSVGASDGSSGLGLQVTTSVGGVNGTGGTLSGGGVGTSLQGTDLTSQANAEAALQTVTNAISAVAYQRGQVGANINTLTAASNISSSEQTNILSAENAITATDYASATSNMSKYEILTQTGISALAQANSTEQMVTKLLQ